MVIASTVALSIIQIGISCPNLLWGRGGQALMKCCLKISIKRINCIYLLFNLNSFFLTETGREVQGEPQRADSLRVPCPGGVGVQPAPAWTRDHAPLQTPAADLLALVTHQEDDHQAPLLILCFPRYPSSHLSPRPRLTALKVPLAVTQLHSFITTDSTVLPLTDLRSAKGTHVSKTFFSSIVDFYIHHHYMDFWKKGLNRLQTSCFSSLHVFTRLHLPFVYFRPLLLIKRALMVNFLFLS